MTKKHIIDLVIKVAGIYFAILAFEYLIELLTVSISGVFTSRFPIDRLIFNSIAFIIHYLVSLFIILKSEKLSAILFGTSKHTEELEKSKYPDLSNKKFLASLIIKAIGIVLLSLSIINIPRTLYSSFVDSMYPFGDSNFLNRELHKYIKPLTQLIVSLTLIRCPRWLLKLLKL